MKSSIQRVILSVILLIGGLVLSSCHKAPPPAPSGTHPLTPYQRSLVSEIRSSGAWIVKQGEVLQIILPTDKFFRTNTTNLKSNKIHVVNRITTLVKSYASYYRNPKIYVTGYTDTIFSRQTRKMLSLQYAREIAAYLWNKGVPQRWVSVRGYGAKNPIASNSTAKGSAYNRRVVIRIG